MTPTPRPRKVPVFITQEETGRREAELGVGKFCSELRTSHPLAVEALERSLAIAYLGHLRPMAIPPVGHS